MPFLGALMKYSLYLQSFRFCFSCLMIFNVRVLLCVLKHELCQQDNLLIRESENAQIVGDWLGLYLSQYIVF